jgi:uncharacterized protein
VTDIEIRTISLPLTASGGRIGGYAAVFGAKSHPLVGPRGVFTETISSRAFNKSKGDGFHGVRCRLEHRDTPEHLLGTTDSGNLKLSIDANGLGYVVDLIPSHQYLAEQVERRIIPGSSFAFDMPQDEWVLYDRMLLRTIHSCRLIDVAPVCEGAYPTADCGLRALDSFAKFVGAPIEEVRRRAEEDGDLRGFLAVTVPKPGYREPVEMRKRIDAIKGKSPALMDAEETTEDETVEETEPKPVAARTIQGRQALMETLAAKPNGPDRLLETLAAQQFSGAERLAETECMGTVEGQIAALHAELAEQRADIARLSDPARIELEDAQAELDRADTRARDELDMVNGNLSGAAALRIMGAAPVATSRSEPRSEPSPDVIRSSAEAQPDTPPEARWLPPTMDPHEALRQLETMRRPEPERNAGRACDSFLSEMGGRL